MKRNWRMITGAALLALCGTGTAHAAPGGADGAGSRCAGLAATQLNGVEIVSATPQDGGAVSGAKGPSMGSTNGGAPISGLPAFCRVVGRIRPEPKSDIGFELWLPRAWNGRLTSAGSPGAAGSILYYMLAGAVRTGDAGLSNDGGHRGEVTDGSWAAGHPERIRDYGWRAAHLSTLAGKALVARYYGRRADHAYFLGVSNGGRQALVEASRFPGDYDGILAGAPAADLTLTRMAGLWVQRAQLAPAARIRSAQAKLLQTEVLRQCDALDGQFDGLIDDPRRCHLDTAKLGCGTAPSPDCFTPAQIAALDRIYAGYRDKAGRWVALPFLPGGSEVADPLFGWDNILFARREPSDDALAQAPVRSLDGRTISTTGAFDFDRDPQRLKAANAFAGLDASPDLRRFFARGGKLIIWHGWADADVPPQISLDYYARALRISGRRAAKSMRLFMVPGLQHGTGGKGADLFGQMTTPPKGATPENDIAVALQAWVETGRVPESLVGKRHSSGATEAGAPPARPPRERLICAYPERAVLAPGADPDQGSSYRCRR
jgi:feruloyl esterase